MLKWAMVTNHFSQELIYQIIQKVLKIIGIAIGAYIVQKIAVVSIRKLTNRDKPRIETLITLLEESTKIVINFIGLLLILAELGVNIVPLITGAGVIGLAIGMGAKDIASDLIAGIFILIENRFNVGETIEVNSKYKGKVTKIDLRTITLESEDGNLHIIPNSFISTLTKIK
jgi:small-conductance mechanosensitive channel